MTEDEKTKNPPLPEKTEPVDSETKNSLRSLEMLEVDENPTDIKAATPGPPFPKTQDRFQEGATRLKTGVHLAEDDDGWSKKFSDATKKMSAIVSEHVGAFRKLFEAFSDKATVSEKKNTDQGMIPFLESFGPTILVGFIFFAWTIYDHTQRPHIELQNLKSYEFTQRALEELSRGNTTQAKLFLTEAMRSTTDPSRAEQLERILKQIK